jgi:hypothetical protein
MKQSIAYGMEKIGAPCVVVKCEGVSMYFLIDTGSTENHLLDYTYKILTKHFAGAIQDEEGSFVTSGVGGSVECKKCTFAFSIGHTRFEDFFVVLPNSQVFIDLSKKLDEPLAGILGGRFLKNNGIVIDYANNCLYTKRQRKVGKRKTDINNAA